MNTDIKILGWDDGGVTTQAKLQKCLYNDPLVMIKVNNSNRRQKEVE